MYPLLDPNTINVCLNKTKNMCFVFILYFVSHSSNNLTMLRKQIRH